MGRGIQVFFHKKDTWRAKKNKILKLKRDDRVATENLVEMEELATNFFSNICIRLMRTFSRLLSMWAVAEDGKKLRWGEPSSEAKIDASLRPKN
jgi:hypothetical protein